ncbi:MAG: methionyl-tRNA formyltransferase [Acidimicrobiia bacterium]|nr:methionyl-tRNA formyltransferase [Acidimicrobiia bacterium]NNL48885.1 methionyl-tRNA formyltransferase [Acidimicrobiia bacterium]
MTRVAFFGTPSAAVPSLAAISEVAEIALVVTRPDRPQRRSKQPVAPPVKVAANQWGMEVVQPELPGELIDAMLEVDVAVVVAYGQIIPDALLIAPRRGFVNLHFSLLPRWRGAAPVARAILAGDEHTGVSLMQLDSGLDTGPVFATWRTEIARSETTGTLTARLAGVGAALLASQLQDYVDGSIQLMDQVDEYATIAGKLETPEARLDHRVDRDTALSHVRAFNPSPGAWMDVEGERIKVWKATRAPVQVPAGSLDVSSGAALLGLSDGTIELLEVQPGGKRRMRGAEWARGVTWESIPLDKAD